MEALRQRKPTACLEEMEAKVARGEVLSPGQRQWLREAGIDPDAWLAAPKHSRALGQVVQRLLREAGFGGRTGFSMLLAWAIKLRFWSPASLAAR